MDDNVKTQRGYRSVQRAEQASVTRHAILAAARELFVANGYLGTTVTQIARLAGVNVDTLYAALGRKPAIMRELVETGISGSDAAVPAAQRDYVRAVQAAVTAGEKIDIYALAIAEMGPRTAPIFRALRDAALTDAPCRELFSEITGRRAANMRRFAADLRSTGELRSDLSDDQVADIVWATNSHDYYLLLVGDCGWTPEAFGRHLSDAWRRLLLA